MIEVIDFLGGRWALLNHLRYRPLSRKGLQEAWAMVLLCPADWSENYRDMIPIPIFTEWWP